MEVNDIVNATAQAYGKNFRIDGEGTRSQAARGASTRKTAEAADPQDRGTVLEKVVQPVERFMGRIGVEIKFHVHEETGEMQAEVMDPSGEKVLRKIPSDEILRLAASIKEMSDHYLNKAL